MPKFNRRKGDGDFNKSPNSCIHYRRKPNEVREISDFLKLCINSHSMKPRFEESKSFRCTMNDFLDYPLANPIPEMIRKAFKILTFSGRDRSKCRQKSSE